MFCPNCGQEQICPCKNCKPHHKRQDVWIWSVDGESISCCKCGLTAHADWWEELSMSIAYVMGDMPPKPEQAAEGK